MKSGNIQTVRLPSVKNQQMSGIDQVFHFQGAVVSASSIMLTWRLKGSDQSQGGLRLNLFLIIELFEAESRTNI